MGFARPASPRRDGRQRRSTRAFEIDPKSDVFPSVGTRAIVRGESGVSRATATRLAILDPDGRGLRSALVAARDAPARLAAAAFRRLSRRLKTNDEMRTSQATVRGSAPIAGGGGTTAQVSSPNRRLTAYPQRRVSLSSTRSARSSAVRNTGRRSRAVSVAKFLNTANVLQVGLATHDAQRRRRARFKNQECSTGNRAQAASPPLIARSLANARKSPKRMGTESEK